MIFYTYLWLRDDGTPYYAGKGSGKRAFVLHGHHLKPPKVRENILIQEWPDEAGALEGEKLLIAIYGRKDIGTGCLRNLTDGGENPPKRSFLGCKHSDESKERNRLSHLNPSAETRAKISAAGIGRIASEETRKKMSASQKGKTKGRPCTLDRALKASLALKGRPWSESRRKAQKVK
jgi:hypothetical protein